MRLTRCAILSVTQQEEQTDSGLNIPDSEEPLLCKTTNANWNFDVKSMIEKADMDTDELAVAFDQTDPYMEETAMLETMGIMGNSFISYADPIDRDKLMRINDTMQQRCKHPSVPQHFPTCIAFERGVRNPPRECLM